MPIAAGLRPGRHHRQLQRDAIDDASHFDTAAVGREDRNAPSRSVCFASGSSRRSRSPIVKAIDHRPRAGGARATPAPILPGAGHRRRCRSAIHRHCGSIADPDADARRPRDLARRQPAILDPQRPVGQVQPVLPRARCRARASDCQARGTAPSMRTPRAGRPVPRARRRRITAPRRAARARGSAPRPASPPVR